METALGKSDEVAIRDQEHKLWHHYLRLWKTIPDKHVDRLSESVFYVWENQKTQTSTFNILGNAALMVYLPSQTYIKGARSSSLTSESRLRFLTGCDEDKRKDKRPPIERDHSTPTVR